MHNSTHDEEGTTSEYIRTFYCAIGQGISFWSSMEGILVCVAAKLLGTTGDKAGLSLYSINNFYSWLTIIDELFTLEGRYSIHKSDWGKISAKLRSLNDTRVRLAHHTNWGGSPDDGGALLRPHIFDVRAKSRKYAPLDMEEITSFSGEVLKVERSLVALIKSMRGAEAGRLIPFQGRPASLNPGPPHSRGA